MKGKTCMMKFAELVSPKKRQALANISLTRNIIAEDFKTIHQFGQPIKTQYFKQNVARPWKQYYDRIRVFKLKLTFVAETADIWWPCSLPLSKRYKSCRLCWHETCGCLKSGFYPDEDGWVFLLRFYPFLSLGVFSCYHHPRLAH